MPSTLRYRATFHLAVALVFLLAPRLAPAQSSTPRTLLGATAGAVGGALGGALIGGNIASSQASVCSTSAGDPDGCLGATIPGLLWGTGVGITIGTPIGAHLGNRRQGKLLYTALTSVGLFAGELLAFHSMVHDRQTAHKGLVFGLAFAMPVVQIIATTLVERAASR